MKKSLTLFLSLSLLTACGNAKTSSDSEKTASIEKSTEITTEKETEEATVPLVSYSFNERKSFETFEEFDNYMNSNEKEKDFGRFFTEETLAITGGITVFKPVYDESKYEFRGATFVGSSYSYSFTDLSTGNVFSTSIEKSYSPQTFEEMVESANANLVVAVENIQTSVWGNTPALIQAIPFSGGYSIRAMIDEDDHVYMSGTDMTPEGLTATLNDITFE